MFEGLISMILNKVLGDFIDNLDSEQLDVSITTGDVVLQNLKVKPTIFDSLPLPFSIAYGQVGLIYMKIPIWNLTGQPLVIEIKDILVVVKPKHIKEWNEDVEVKSYKDSNQSAIEQFEIFNQNAENLTKKDPSSVEKLAEKLLHNLTINIENIYVRYEDSITATNHGTGNFAVGVLLKEFSIGNFGSDFKSKSAELGQDIIYKLAAVQGFSVFLDYNVHNPDYNDKNQIAQTQHEHFFIDIEKLSKDKTNQTFKAILKEELNSSKKLNHNYLIDNFNMQVRAKLNKVPLTNLLPQIEVDLILGAQFEQTDNTGVNFIVHQPQIIRILKLIEYIGYYNEFQQGALARFQSKSVSQEIADQYIKLYCEWKILKESKANQKKIEEKRKQLQQIEDEYPVEKLLVLRKFGGKIIKSEKEQKKNQKELDKKLKDLKSSQNWGVFTSKEKKAQYQKELDDYKLMLQKELSDKQANQKDEIDQELQQLQQDLSNQQIISTEEFDKLPRDYIRFKFSIALPLLNLSFKNEFDQLIFNAQMREQSTHLNIGQKRLLIDYQIYSLTLQDCWSNASAFPDIIKTQEMSQDGYVISETELIYNAFDNKKFALKFQMEFDDAFVITPFKMRISSEKTLFIVVNFYFIKEFLRSLTAALEGETLDFSFFQETASRRALEYINQGKELIETIQKGQFQHQALDLSLFLTSPIFIMPQNVFQPQLPCLYVDTGSIELGTKLIEYKNDFDYKLINNPSKVFDRYEAFLNKLQIGIFENGLINGLNKFSKSQSQQIMHDFNAQLCFFNCLDPFHPIHPTVELTAIIESFSIRVGLKFVGSIIKIINSIIEQLDETENLIFNFAIETQKNEKSLDQQYQHEKILQIRNENLKFKQQKEQEESKQGNIFVDESPTKFQSNLSSEEDNLVLEKKESIYGPQTTNFKIYFAVEKFEIMILKEITNKQTHIIEDYDNLLHVLLLHFGVEFEIDRQQNIVANATIFKAMIQDLQKETEIAEQFRLIMSSPMIEQQNELKANDKFSSNKYSKSKDYKSGVIQKSLLYYVESNETNSNSTLSTKKTLLNQLECSFQMLLNDSKTEIQINAELSDLRFVLSVPTTQNLLMVYISIEVRINELIRNQDLQKKVKLQLFEKVLSNLNNDEIFQKDDELLLRKQIINAARVKHLDKETAQELSLQAIESLQKVWNSEEYQQKISQQQKIANQQQVEEGHHKNMNILTKIVNKGKELPEKKVEVELKINIDAKIHSLALWLPMYADTEQSQILSLQLFPEFTFEKDERKIDTIETTLNQVISSELIESFDAIGITISHFIIQTMTLQDYEQYIRSQIQQDNTSQNVQSSRILAPCRVGLSIENYCSTDFYQRCHIKIDVDPMHIKIGFRQIDFANMVIFQTLNMIEKVRKYEEEKKAQILLQRAMRELIKDVKKEEQKENQFKLNNQELEINEEDHKLKDIYVQKFFFKKYDPQVKSKVTKTRIQIECETITVAVSDDSEEAIGEMPFVHLAIQNTQFVLKNYDKESDAATFILKKLGVWQKLHPKESKNHQYQDLTAFTSIQVNYYNQKVLAFEPLIEPWFVIFSLSQHAPYTQLNMKIDSDRLLNIDLSFGMAMTLGKLMEGILESLKQASILVKINDGQVVTPEELSRAKIWKKKLVNKKQGRKIEIRGRKDSNQEKGHQQGFLFENYTGIDLKIAMHDEANDDNLELIPELDNSITNTEEEFKSKEQQNKTSSKLGLSRLNQPMKFDKNQAHVSQFKSYEDLLQLQKEITLKRNQGKPVQSLEDDPLKMDFKFDGLKKFNDIPIEGCGVYSYRADLNELQNIDKEGQNKLRPFRRIREIVQGDSAKRKVGFVVKILMEGLIKKVMIESQVLIINNLQRPITIIARSLYQSVNHEEQIFEEKVVIEAKGLYKVPLSWIYTEHPNSLFLSTDHGNQILFKNIDELFTDKLSNSKLSQDQSQIFSLEPNFYTSVDLIAYNCLPRNQEDNPPQYVVYFNNPLTISNFNFHSLQVRNSHHPHQNYAILGPKETAQLNCLEYLNTKPNIDWIYFETESDHIQLTTLGFDFMSLVDKKTMQKFWSDDKQCVNLQMDIKKIYIQNIVEYQENFDFREKLKECVSTLQVVIYPKYMFINKTSTPFLCNNHLFKPYSNEYFVPNEKGKIQFKVSGFKSSVPIDVNTIGLSGSITFDVDKKQDIIVENLPTKQYIPEKLEFGLKISTPQHPFNGTTLISIVPRFVLINHLKKPLIIKQKNQSTQVLLNNKVESFNFEQFKNKFVMIRLPNEQEQKLISENVNIFEEKKNQFEQDDFWSSPFSLEDIDDFQVCFYHHQEKEKEQNWYHPNPQNNFQRFVRVIVTTQNDATISVVFTNPQLPEYEIHNKSDYEIEIAQLEEPKILNKRNITVEEMVIGDFEKIKPNTAAPYTWANRLNNDKLLALRLGIAMHEINIERALKKTEIESSEKIKFFVEVKVTGNNKKVFIHNKTDEEKDEGNFKQALYFQNLLRRHQSQLLNFEISLKGITVSLIDEKPQELLLLTVYEPKIQYQQWIEAREDFYGEFETISKLSVQLKHTQIDNQATHIMPVILAPRKALLKIQNQQAGLRPLEEIKEETATQSEMTSSEPEETPFFQLIISMAESHNIKANEPQTRLRTLQVAMQEFSFQIDTAILENNLKLILSIVQIFSGQNRKTEFTSNEEFFEKAKYLKREQICEDLDPEKAVIIEKETVYGVKTFIEYIHFGTIKAYITFKIEKMNVELDVSDPRRGFGVINFLYNVLAGIASISNSPLSFNELILIDIYSSQNVLVQQLSKNYARQGLRQFYKLVGSSDLIGNPVGLVNKLGTGVYEFISEPAKGLLKGPDEFGKGVGKGVQSLVTNVVSGGFDSVSKITGSLYTVLKSVQGEGNIHLDRAESLRSGFYYGVKGGVSELVGGVTGLVTKPFKKTKQEGAKGFIKGLGSGIVGAITAPMAATLRVGSSVTQGISNSASSAGQIGRIATLDTNSQFSRFRPPRYINTKNIVTIYNQQMALVSRILNSIYMGRFSQQSIKAFAMLPETKQNGEIVSKDPSSSLLLITDRMVFYIKIQQEGNKKGQPDPLFKARLWRIKSCCVYQSSVGSHKFTAMYAMVIECQGLIGKGVKEYTFQSNDYYSFEKIYNFLSMLPQCQANNKVKKEEHKKDSKFTCL